jgi:C-terminal binding protein
VLLALSLRRGLILYHDTQRGPDPAGWAKIESPLHRRQQAQTFGILGLGRIGTAAALRAEPRLAPLAFFGADAALGQQLFGTISGVLLYGYAASASDVAQMAASLGAAAQGSPAAPAADTAFPPLGPPQAWAPSWPPSGPPQHA